MKRGLLITATFIIVVTAFLACTKRAQKSDVCMKAPVSSMAKAKNGGAKKDNTETTIKCNGSCANAACSLEGVYSPTEHWVQCKCDNCSMQITTKTTDSNGVVTTDTTNMPGGSQVQVEYLGNFKDYMAAEHAGVAYSITAVNIYDDGVNDNYLVQYEFLTATGDVGTIMYENKGADGKNISIDCKGKCDCRERYFPNTGAVECTCKDCNMEVRDIPDVK